MYILVDTNVYLDIFLKREGFQDSKLFFKYCAKKQNKTFVTPTSLRDIGYIVHRYCHDKTLSKRAQVEAYRMTTKIIGVSESNAIDALYSDVDDYEDALLVEAARENGLDIIVTNNISDFKYSPIRAFTPKQLCDIWSSEED